MPSLDLHRVLGTRKIILIEWFHLWPVRVVDGEYDG